MDLRDKFGWGLPGEIWTSVEAIDVLKDHLEFIEQQIDQNQKQLKHRWED